MLSAQTPATTEAVPSKELVAVRTSKNWRQVGLTFVCWQVLAVLFCELVLFTAGIGEEEIFKFDKALGFRHFPDKIVTWRSEGFARSYFDADGMREPGLTVSKPANTLRVALLGDSLTESLQVPIEQSFGKLIEKNIGPVNGKTVQVINFGNSGYSTTQECLLLEEKVFKYKPDLVILGYSSRDMMENWSPPDETLSNVRPAALKLPGHELIIDNTPVTNWLQSPRARFLQSIEWFRHHSRVWGIISATELQLSMKDPIVKSLLGFCTNPVRSSRAAIRSVNAYIKSLRHGVKQQVNVEPVVAVVPAKAAAAAAWVSVIKPDAVPTIAKAATSATNFTSGNASVRLQTPVVDADPAERSQYTRLVSATMEGLIERMNKDCVDHQSEFMVVGLPCRVDISPYDGFQGVPELTFLDELAIIRKSCTTTGVTFFDANSPAHAFSAPVKKSLFFSAHMAPAGHVYTSEALLPAVRKALRSN